MKIIFKDIPNIGNKNYIESKNDEKLLTHARLNKKER